MRVYVEEISCFGQRDVSYDRHIGRVFKTIEDFEKHKNDGWRNGECEWKLISDHINTNEPWFDFRQYSMKMIGRYGDWSNYVITLQGKEVIG